MVDILNPFILWPIGVALGRPRRASYWTCWRGPLVNLLTRPPTGTALLLRRIRSRRRRKDRHVCLAPTLSWRSRDVASCHAAFARCSFRHAGVGVAPSALAKRAKITTCRNMRQGTRKPGMMSQGRVVIGEESGGPTKT